MDPSIEEDDDDIFSDHDDIYSVTGDLITESDVLVYGVDNLYRSILNAISSKLGITMVNAGAQGFNSQFDLFTPWILHALQIRMHALREGARMSCQEDGDVPFGLHCNFHCDIRCIGGTGVTIHTSEGPDPP